MAPKRKAEEPAQAELRKQSGSNGEQPNAATASGTLAGASGHSVDTLLDRVGNKRLRSRAAKGLKTNASGAFPLPKPRAIAEAICGAPAQAQAATAEQKLAEQKDADQDDLASASDWEWEDAADEEEDWETAEADVPMTVSGVTGSFDVEASEAAAAGPSRPRRKGITKEEREMARLLHRSHLLCLLSRGLLYDQAASDPLLQATMLSLVSPEVMPPSDPTQGFPPAALQPLLSWFRHTLQQQPIALHNQVQDVDELDAPANGLETVTEQLQAVVTAKEGTAEQLQTVFVALCRAHGLLVRSVRVLDPIPLRPGVQKMASAHLKQPRRQKPKANNASAADTATVATADASGRNGRGRKRKSAESGESFQAVTASEATDQGVKVSKAAKKPASKSSKRKGTAVAHQEDNRRAADSETQQNGKSAAKARGSKKGAKSKAQEPDAADLQLQDDMAAACAASLADAQPNDSGLHQPDKAKRVGDIELENQLAMAMASTAAEAQHREKRKPISAAVHNEPMPSAFSPRSGGAKPTLGETWTRDAGLATQDFAQSDAASYWAEVFCGTAEQGRWTHIDPLLGWLDVADKVEGARCMPGGLAYVVAFANKGAKDVTQRYVGSVLAADKMRDNVWWEQTLKPLRKHEVAATTLHHKALHLPDPQSHTGSGMTHDQNLSGAAPPHDTSPKGQHQSALSISAASGKVPKTHDESGKFIARAAELALKREDAELGQRAAAERRGLPSNVEGFKHHPVYVLERHISRYFALKPGTKKVGMHRGEGFYHRDALAELHTADRWLRDGLEVKSEELATPYKVVRRRGVKDAPGPAPDTSKEVPEEDEIQASSVIPVSDAMVTKMYGRWQTQQWEVPTAVGGVVPKNDRGNVHCPPLASELPKGTVHLQMPRLGPICKKLAVDYAPAMTGFDIRGGRSVPVIEGVVVCKDDEASVLEAYIVEERLREERAAERRKQEADAGWRRLLRSIWTRLRLHQDYGDNAAAHAGQDHAHQAVAGVFREDLSEDKHQRENANQAVASTCTENLSDQAALLPSESARTSDSCALAQAGAPAEVVDLVEDQAEHSVTKSPAPGSAQSPTVKAEAAEADTHESEKSGTAGQLGSVEKQKKTASRPPKGRRKAEDSTAAVGEDKEQDKNNALTEKKIQRRSKSGVEVEMEEI